jgi:branched-chain amino acid transport system substrate-binding protein
METRRNKMGDKKFLACLGLCFFLLTVCLIPVSGVSAAEKKEIIVGIHLSLTGPLAMPATESKWATEQAVADINTKGGVFVKELNKKLPIKLIIADDKGSADQGAAAMERLIKVDKIDLALSDGIASIGIAVGTVCEKYKVYLQTTCMWLDFIEKENFKWVSSFFTSTSAASETPFKIWKALPKDQEPKRPVLMMEDNQDGQAFGMGFKTHAEKYAYKFVVDEPFTPGAKDFSSQILKWNAAKVDALLVLMSPTDGIVLLRQMKEQNLRVPYLHGWKGFWAREFEQGLGKDANYVIHDGFWSDKYGAPGSKELQERFVKQFKRDSTSIGIFYANPQILAMAIEKAGSIESEKVRDAVFGGEFKGTMMGDVKYNEKGLGFMEFLALQWWDGDRKPVYPPNPGWKYKPAPNTWK